MISSLLLSAILAINELMASNTGEVMSPAINFDSWIEIYNPGDKDVNLAGMYLSARPENLTFWKMPAGVGKVPAKGYAVVWLGSNDIESIQAPFKLDCDGGTIYLSDKDGQLIVSQEYPAAMSHTAWARKTDGTGDWEWTSTPTPGATNATAAFANQRLGAPVVSVGSKLFTGTLQVKVDIPAGARLMYTTNGSLPKAPKGEGEEEVSPWIEWVKNGDCEGTDATCFVSKDGDSREDVNRITDGVGTNNSRGIKVHSVAGAANDWTSQFFVYTPNHVWQTGEKYRFRMKARADKAARIKVKAQRTPGDQIADNMLAGSYNVTSEWTEISYEGTVTSDQSGEEWDWGWGGWSEPTVTYSLQTIAFHLNVQKDADNNFYFDDISWELLPLNLEEEPTHESKDGLFDIASTTNYTFRLYQDGYLPSVPVTRSYIQTSNKYTLPVISIVGDEKFFNDPEIGFDCDGDGTNGKTGNGQDYPKNYNNDWDRPANFSYLSPEGEMLFNQDVNICVSGGYTRSQRFRSFKLKASKIFDGQNRFDYSFFPQKPYIRSKVLLLRNGGNDLWAHNARFMDPALETIIQRSGIDVDVQSYVPIIEYVNGELRGVLNMREPNNDKFADANWGYDDEELDAFENMKMKNGTDSVINRIFELGGQATDDEAYKELKALLDIDEFTNYMAVTLFLFNDDWPDNNIKAYRSRNDGRYRFVSYDLDYAFAGCWNTSGEDPFANFVKFKDDKSAPRTSYNKAIVNLLLNLMGREDYRRKFIDTFCVVGGSVFEPTRSGKIVDELLKKVQSMCQLMKQQGINDGHDPKRCADDIKSKLKGRSAKMAGYLKKFSYAKLSSSAQNVTLTADTEGAQLFVNDIAVPYAEFKGHLFAPVRLKAVAPAGYSFAGWKKGSAIVSSDAEMTLPSDATLSLTATFTKGSTQVAPVRINEVSAANGIYVNEYFKRNDWVELYNTTDQPVDVEGMYLSDNTEKPKKFQISRNSAAASTIIPAHGFLVVWCDKLDTDTHLHASFKLDADRGDVLLTAADESWSDQIAYVSHKENETVGRYPDGANQVYVMNIPTIAQANIWSSYVSDVEQPETSGIYDIAQTPSTLDCRYSQGSLFIRSHSSGAVRLSVHNLSGQSVSATQTTVTCGSADVSVAHLSSGVYVATVIDDYGHTATVKFVKD